MENAILLLGYGRRNGNKTMLWENPMYVVAMLL
jgi:hypothetical protein